MGALWAHLAIRSATGVQNTKILNIFDFISFFNGKNYRSNKQLKKVIKDSKKKEKKVEKEIKVLEESKASSKKEIGNLKRKLTNSKKKTQKMEKAFDDDNADEALEFLRKFANK